LFDSWAGVLSPHDYATKVLPSTRKVFDGVRETGVPTIHFGTGIGGFLESFAAAGSDVVGIDWRMPIDAAWSRIERGQGVQGNLDPSALLGPTEDWRDQALDVLRRIGGRPGHIFNLGHGVLPDTPIDSLRSLVSLVHDFQGR
jgi:uroporphyrinogen decarboxylase